MLDKLKRRIPDAKDEALLADLIEAAGGMICACTLREAVPPALQAVQLEIAAMLYNRMGMEGERIHAEGSLSVHADSLPEYLRRQINPWRLAKAVEGCG
jgi:hypothetical protein